MPYTQSTSPGSTAPICSLRFHISIYIFCEPQTLHYFALISYGAAHKRTLSHNHTWKCCHELYFQPLLNHSPPPTSWSSSTWLVPYFSITHNEHRCLYRSLRIYIPLCVPKRFSHPKSWTLFHNIYALWVAVHTCMVITRKAFPHTHANTRMYISYILRLYCTHNQLLNFTRKKNWIFFLLFKCKNMEHNVTVCGVL